MLVPPPFSRAIFRRYFIFLKYEGDKVGRGGGGAGKRGKYEARRRRGMAIARMRASCLGSSKKRPVFTIKSFYLQARYPQ